MSVRRRALLVDGYNVIRSTPPYQHIAEKDLDSARAALVSDVAAFAQGEWEAVVVFDGGGNPHSTGEGHQVAGITVVFSPYGTDADTVLESYSKRIRETGDEVLVVSSDAQLQWAVMGGSVTRRSAAGFSAELRAGASEWQGHNPAGKRRVTIEERLDPVTRDTLARWARGER